eukprot:5112742-Pyramimonas_sp.AAC.1
MSRSMCPWRLGARPGKAVGSLRTLPIVLPLLLRRPWLRSVELATDSRHQQAPPALSRGQAVQFRSKPQRIQPLRDRVAGWWARASTIVHSLASHRQRQNGDKQQQIIIAAARDLLSQDPRRAT